MGSDSGDSWGLMDEMVFFDVGSGQFLGSKPVSGSVFCALDIRRIGNAAKGRILPATLKIPCSTSSTSPC